jgi:hypothetical protein
MSYAIPAAPMPWVAVRGHLRNAGVTPVASRSRRRSDIWSERGNLVAHPVASRPSPVIHDWSFDRFDEITDPVEKASDLTLTRHWRVEEASPTATPSLCSSSAN